MVVCCSSLVTQHATAKSSCSWGSGQAVVAIFTPSTRLFFWQTEKREENFVKAWPCLAPVRGLDDLFLRFGVVYHLASETGSLKITAVAYKSFVVPRVVLLLWHLPHVWNSEILPVGRQLTQLTKSDTDDHGNPHHRVGSSLVLRWLAMQLPAMMNKAVCSPYRVQQCRHHTQMSKVTCHLFS
jgi:hypothetical protein